MQGFRDHPGVRRVELQVESRGLDRLLFFTGQAGEAVGESVGNAELSHFPSPRSRMAEPWDSGFCDNLQSRDSTEIGIVRYKRNSMPDRSCRNPRVGPINRTASVGHVSTSRAQRA